MAVQASGDAAEPHRPLLARRLGARLLGRLNDPCGSTGAPRLTPLGPQVIWGGTWCPVREGPERGSRANGYASILPSLGSQPMRWLRGAVEFADRDRTVAGAGPPYLPGRVVLQDPSGWGTTRLWRLVGDPAAIEPIGCLPPEPPDPLRLQGWTTAEVGPGVCIAFDPAYATPYRNGAPIGQLQGWFYGAQFRVGASGLAALKELSPGGHPWPVLDASGHVLFEVDEYEEVTGVAFDASGERMYAGASLADAGGAVVDEYTAAGRVARHLGPGGGRGLAVDEAYLWVARTIELDPDDPGVHLQLERWNRPSMTLDRAIVVPRGGPAGIYGWVAGIQVEILPELDGRRAHLLGWIDDNLGVYGYTVDFE